MRSWGLLTGNRRLDRYLVSVYATGIAAAAAGVLVGEMRFNTPLILFTLYAAAAAPFLVSLGSNAYLTTAFPFILASAVLLGPGAAVVTAAAGSLSLGIARRNRMPVHKVAFNVCNHVVGGVVAALLFRALGGNPLSFSSEESIRAFLGATCAFYLVNTLLMTGAVGLERGVPILDFWVEKFQWTAYSFLAGGSCSLLVILFLQRAGVYSFVIIFPFCALIYHSWKAYVVTTGLGRSGSSTGIGSSPSGSPTASRGGQGLL